MEIIKVVLTSSLSAAALFLIAKVIGHKQMSQLDFFDYITGITIGSIGAEMATELEEPIIGVAAADRGGVALVLLCDRVKDERSVLYALCDRANLVERAGVGDKSVTRNRAVGGL